MACLPLYLYLYNTTHVSLHSEFADEGILGYLDLKLDLLRFIHCIRHTACDDGCGVATGDRGVNVEAVYIHILFLLRHQTVQSYSIICSYNRGFLDGAHLLLLFAWDCSNIYCSKMAWRKAFGLKNKYILMTSSQCKLLSNR